MPARVIHVGATTERNRKQMTDSSAAQQFELDPDQGAWDRYVLAHEGANYCHLFGWKEVFEKAYRKKCHFVALSDDQNLIGIAPFVQMKGFASRGRLVSLPFLDRGGVLADKQTTCTGLLDRCLRLSEKLGTHGVTLRGSLCEPVDEARQTDRFRLLLDLGASEEELWSKIGAKVRNQIRKSQKSKLETKEVSSDRLPDFYRVFAANMRDLGSPTHSRGFFSEIFRVFSDHARLFLTFDRTGQVVAGAVALDFRQERCVPWASSLRSARSACPNHSLYWGVLQDAIGLELESFDFGRSSVGTGTYRFKKQWGAQPEPLFWKSLDSQGVEAREKIASPTDYPWVTAAWRRIPLGLTTRLGPLIRRRLSN